MASVEALSGRIGASDVRQWQEVKKGYTRFQDGDVLFAKITPCMENGKAAIARGVAGGVGTGSMEFHVLRPGPALRPEILLHYVLREEFRKSAQAQMTGTAGLLRVPSRFLDEQTVPVSPLPEQHRIVSSIESYFTRLDDAVAALERVQHNLKRYRASVLKAAVEGRLVPTEAELARAEGRDYEPASVLLTRILAERRRRLEEAELAKMTAKGKAPKDDSWKAKYVEPAAPDTRELPELPEGWCWATVEQLGDVTGGLTQNATRETLPRQLPFLRVANVYANELRLDEVKTIGVADSELARACLASGDLLVVEGNGSIEQIGRVALWDGSIDPCLHQNHLIKVRFSLLEMSEWCLCWLLAPPGRVAVERAASSTSGLHTLSLSKVGRLPVPLPPLAEQIRVTTEMDRLTTIAVTAMNEAAMTARRLTRLRQSILKWAFEGRLVDQDPTDEPASVLLERIRAERASAHDQPPRRPRRANARARKS